MKLIVFVHGALSTKRSFAFIEQGLNKSMYRAMSQLEGAPELHELNPWELRSFSYDIRKEPGKATVSRLVKQLNGYLKSFEVDRLVLICHSFGGVLGVDAVRHLHLSDASKASVISMSTPYGGATIASLIKLFKKSTFLDNIGSYEPFIREFLSKPLPCRVRKIITTEGSADFLPGINDGVVTVDSQLALADDPLSSHVKVKLNHFEVLLSQEVVDIIITELNRP
jgi:pimeloyl-ACP methyl ester carboxylesterase